MQGHIRKRSKGSWTVVIDRGRDAQTGKRKQQWFTVKGTKADAQARQAELLVELGKGADLTPVKVTVAEYLERWLRDYAQALAPKTYRLYSDVVRSRFIPAFGSMNLGKLRPVDIQGLYTKLRAEGLSPGTVRRYHQILNSALHRAQQWGVLKGANPCENVDPPRVERRDMRVLDPDEVRRLLEVADTTAYGCLIHTAVSTGMRMGEILGARWSDLDMDNSVLRIQQTVQWLPKKGFIYRQPKTAGSRRSIALGAESIRRLRHQRAQQAEHRLMLGKGYKDKDLIFATALGTPIEPSNLRREFNKMTEAAGLGRLRFHDLRHCHASLMLAQGTHLKVVSERLGHSGIAITANVYSHLLPGLQKEAADQFDRLIASSR